ncbi:helix-turn-helix domain-containing protein [Tenacibaculum halocynthiae]|uniref:helix-turn-helix domain-containing protein n=1 Tax=Tenacibaculum halocynthiae TaxID=1254437 RepID=UPI003893DBD3
MRLKELRKNKGETQSELADILKVSLRTIQNYEKGSVTIPNEKLKQISLHYNVTFSDIFIENNDNFDLKQIDRRLISSFITKNWDYMIEDDLFNANFKAKAGEWAISIKKNQN